MEAVGKSSPNEETHPVRAIQIPFVSLYKPRYGTAFPLRELDAAWTIERTGFNHSSTFEAVEPVTMPNLGNHAYSVWCGRTLTSWVDTLVFHAAKSNKYAQAINKCFEIPSNINEVVLSNALTASKTADMISAGVLLHNMWELFDPISFEPLALAAFPKSSDIEFVGSVAASNTKWEIIQTSPVVDEAEFFMIVYPTDTSGDKRRIFVPGFKSPKFTSSFRLAQPGSLGLTLSTLVKAISNILSVAEKTLSTDGPQASDLQVPIHKILDIVMNITQGLLRESQQTKLERLQKNFSALYEAFVYEPIKLAVQKQEFLEVVNLFSDLLRLVDHEEIIDFVMNRVHFYLQG